jgi:ribulose-phosphate 3-epimerase
MAGVEYTHRAIPLDAVLKGMDMLRIADPPPHPLVAASILSADFGRMAEECRDVLEKGADLLHIDVMDGHFVRNLTMGQDMIRALRRYFPDTFLDVHLMVERPGDYVDSFAAAGANLFAFHLELCGQGGGDGLDAAALIDRIHAAGMAAGMAINPATPAEGLAPFLADLDLVLVMSVAPGRSGQSFMPQVLDKTRWLRQRIGPGTRLEMDGGINPTTAREAVAAGADVLVTASALFGATDRAEVIRRMQGARNANQEIRKSGNEDIRE